MAEVLEREAVRRSLLGAYEVIKRGKVFQVSFWAVVENREEVCLEYEDQYGTAIRWVPRKVLEEALRKGDLLQEAL